MHEFEFISSLLAPLAAGEAGALGLADDAALLTVPAGQELVITKDAMVESVHFLGDEPPALIARKLLRVNLSDLAAMGAKPYGYFLALMLPAHADAQWLAGFAEGLHRDQREFGITLLGGDTTRTPGPLSLSLTALGHVPAGKALRRNGAKVGDGVYVSGTIGDSALGLQVTAKTLQTADAAYLLERYQLPRPRVRVGEALRAIATSCIDISDGLMQDLGHIAKQSGVGATIHLENIPLSSKARQILKSHKNAAAILLAGGDDYELLFTVPTAHESELAAVTKASDTPITRIGEITATGSVRALDKQGKEIVLAQHGYRHF